MVLRPGGLMRIKLLFKLKVISWWCVLCYQIIRHPSLYTTFSVVLVLTSRSRFIIFWTSSYGIFAETNNFILKFFMYIHICVTVSVYVHQIHARALREEKVSDLLEAELQLVVRHHMGSGKWTQVLFKSSKHTYPMSHLYSPQLQLLILCHIIHIILFHGYNIR